MATSHWEDNTAQAVTDMINGLAQGDFSLDCGRQAINKLMEYRLDLCVSLWKAWFRRQPTDEERKELNKLVSAKLNLNPYN